MTSPAFAEPSVSGPPGCDGAPDGRRLRADRNRLAVVDALLELYGEGVLQPGAAEIAVRAGVSERSVFRHFADLETLAATAVERQWSRVAQHFAAPDSAGTSAERVGALARQRVALHRAIAPVARAALLVAPSSSTLRATLAARRGLLQRQVADQFRPELETLAPAVRRELLAALDVTASFETLEYLRVQCGLSAPRATAVVSRMLDALLVTAPRTRTRR